MEKMISSELLMGYRSVELQATWNGYKETGKVLVAKSGGLDYPEPVPNSFLGSAFHPSGMGIDDQGFYFFVTLLRELFGIGQVAAVYSLHILMAIVSVLFYVFFVRNKNKKFTLSSIPLLLVLVTAMLMQSVDVYGFNVYVAVAFLGIFVGIENWKLARKIPGLILLGFFCACCSFARGEAFYISVLGAVTMGLLLLDAKKSWMAVVSSVLAFIVPFLLLKSIFTDQQVDSIRYLERHKVNNEITTFKHPMWHNFFAGLGFLQPNKYGLKYVDQIVIDYVRESHPKTEYMSETYLKFLKSEYIRLLQTDPVFFVKTYSAKVKETFLNFQRSALLRKAMTLVRPLVTGINVIGILLFLFLCYRVQGRHRRKYLAMALYGGFLTASAILAYPALVYSFAFVIYAHIFCLYLIFEGYTELYSSKITSKT